VLTVEVDLIEPLGSDTLVYGHIGDADGTRVAARLHASLAARTGVLFLRYDPDNVHWFDPATGRRIEP